MKLRWTIRNASLTFLNSLQREICTMNHFQNSNLIAATIGVTVGVISAASIFIYHKILENQQQATTVSSLDDANKKIAALQAELESIRLQQSQKKKRKVSRKYTSNDSTYTVTDNDTDIDAFSTADTDIGDDEFYDCSDSEGTVGDGDNVTRISEEVNHLALFFNEIDEHANKKFNSDTYYKLQTLVKSNPDNVDIVWRFARSCYQLAESMSDEDAKKKILLEGIESCERVLEISNADLYKWFAILIGLNGEYLPLTDKIKNGNRFKQYVLMALEMEPNDFQLHHLLGRYKYEVASLNWLGKKIASTLFADFTTFTLEEAVASFEESDRLGSTRPENRLYLGKSYIALNEYQKAITHLEKLVEDEPLNVEDEIIHAEATKLLSKYSGHRL